MKRFARTLLATVMAVAALVPAFSAAASAQNPINTNMAPAYVALGDSVAAGLGLPNEGGTSGQDPVCGRSTGAYAYQVAQAKNIDVEHLACSGATVGDLFTKQTVNNTEIPPQLDQAFAQGTPQLITITAGANDIHWADAFKKCYAATCGTRTDDAMQTYYRAVMELKLDAALASIAWRSHGNPPKVVITGYYNPLSPACAVADPVHFTADEMNWAKGQVDKLNQSLQRASSLFSFASFAPVDFTGHDICSADSWVQGQADPAPFHPKAAGQAALAQAVLGKL